MLAKILKILILVLEIATRVARKLTGRRHEKERDRIDDDPVDWMREHFGDADDVPDRAEKTDVDGHDE